MDFMSRKYEVGLRALCLWIAIGLVASISEEVVTANPDIVFQPEIRLVEHRPQRLVYGSISMAEGSPWCGGNKTFWLVGHQLDETPYCYNAELDNWTSPEIAMMDNQDALNIIDMTPPNIDRHDCTTLDINKDGLPDILCAVGADKGEGTGYNEMYLTKPDGSIEKVLEHGLQKYPTIRARYIRTLYNRVDAGNITHVFLSAYGTGRPDGEKNVHTMYRLIDQAPYFEEVIGPWNRHAKSVSMTVADWNQDGRDDLIVMHKRNWTMFFEQGENGTFSTLHYPRKHNTNRIRAARVADVNMDGLPDLIVTTDTFKKKNSQRVRPKFRIFRGVNNSDRFDFGEPYFSVTLPRSAPDIEVLDVNSDGFPDIYVVQTDQRKTSFCGKPMPWRIRPYPPYEWISPVDEAQDLLFVGKGEVDIQFQRFKRITMEHMLPGCGYIVERFGDNKTMILANADQGRAGSNAILSW